MPYCVAYRATVSIWDFGLKQRKDRPKIMRVAEVAVKYFVVPLAVYIMK
jgi:hypothetical protein